MRRVLLAILLLVAPALVMPVAARAQNVTIFAAASLTDALKDAAAVWQRQGHPPLRLSFASSSTLARQIAQGAPADIFASADEKWMDYLASRKLIVPKTRKDLFGNDLVLVVPADHPRHVTIRKGFDLMALLGPNGRLAVGDPTHVPAGIYAKQALTWLGVWQQVKGHLAPALDVRAALLLVERDEAPAGIVYSTDAASTKGVMTAGVFPNDSHKPIAYPFAIVKGHDTPEARALLKFLESPAGLSIFAARGFRME